MTGRLLLTAVFFFLLIPVTTAPGQDRSMSAQDRNARRDQYIARLDLTEERQEVRDFLEEVLRAYGEGNPESLAGLFSFVMVIHGIDGRLLNRLYSGGIDIVHAMTSNARPFMEQGLFSDPVIRGEVIALHNETETDEVYQSTITIRVLEHFKGTVPPDTVYLRQRGRFGEGDMGPREFEPKVGDQYLLLLSRPMYDFFWTMRRSRSAAEAESDDIRPAPGGFYAIYRFYRLDDGRVIMGDGSSYGTEKVFQELRWLEELISNL